ncbi:hypothetical protein DPMN_181818 [Dreissena polymorpha]|uniref:Uncharacterized protein n=1 Tax=Dreissena polymorpha TaxID=45954 RepID=A0A9D4DE97_DREPO|nr:hypothetical protein DPMN_181818 [Dreissena polymorpha]
MFPTKVVQDIKTGQHPGSNAYQAYQGAAQVNIQTTHSVPVMLGEGQKHLKEPTISIHAALF